MGTLDGKQSSNFSNLFLGGLGYQVLGEMEVLAC